jgi:transcriptional regulator with XRE-family HTH domain
MYNFETEKTNMKNQFDGENFGDTLKNLRVEKGLTKTELAKISGISDVQINRYEKNTAKPSDLVLKKLSKALDMPFEDLAGLNLGERFDGEQFENTLERLRQSSIHEKIIMKEVIDRFIGFQEFASIAIKLR